MDDWRTQVPADCLFLDQLGARPWLRDFNPASPTPLAYDDGWLAVMAPYASRCLMVEDGWDRLARDVIGFHGGLLMMSRELDLPNTFFGAGNWEPYPLADLALPRQGAAVPARPLRRHDGGRRRGADVEHGVRDRQLVQLGRSSRRETIPGSTSSASCSVTSVRTTPACRSRGYKDARAGRHREHVRRPRRRRELGRDRSYAAAGYDVAPAGLSRAHRRRRPRRGRVRGSFDGVAAVGRARTTSIVERDAASVTVRQPVGADTDVTVAPPSSWSSGKTLQVTAIDGAGTSAGAVQGALRDGKLAFPYTGELNGRRIAAYRITVSG